jgi:hypothetical protein
MRSICNDLPPLPYRDRGRGCGGRARASLAVTRSYVAQGIAEDDQEDTYQVLADSVRFEFSEEMLEVHREEIVAVRDRRVRRGATALEPGCAVMVIGAPLPAVGRGAPLGRGV